MTANEGLVIRPARPDDEERLAQIIVSAFGHSCMHAIREEMYGVIQGKSWQERKGSEIRHALQSRPDEVWVAELDGKVVGFATYTLHRDLKIGEICNNAVDPEYQGRGIGKALYRKLLDIFREEGCEIAEVATGLSDGYAKARSAYEGVGFKPLIRHIRYTMRLD